MKIRFRGEVARRLPSVLRALHWVTLGAGGVLLAWPMFVAVESSYAQWSGQRTLANEPPASAEEIVTRKPVPRARARVHAKGALLGSFEIPRLNLTYVLLEGTDNRTLDKSIGHVEGTAAVGETGNIGIAGHRNTHFRKLEWIRRDDTIVLKAGKEEYRYRVEWIRLFHPHDLEVLDAEHGPAVTLVTCFPFEYVGAAPLRFIVRALPDEETKARLNVDSPDPSETGPSKKGGAE